MSLPVRKETRLKNYDYSTPGSYFITICTHQKRSILSTVCRGDPCGRPRANLTSNGEIVVRCLQKTEALYHIELTPYVIMPNHVHFICTLSPQRATARVAPTVGRVVGALKSISANLCREAGLQSKLWQRSYYEHIIRNDTDYREIAEYIANNPARWAEDRFHP